jgi:beta-lactamase regulating signal transducer with metallopeptidase domain
MIPDILLPFANHLWQSTLFALAVWLITLALRKNRAAVSHRLWLAASVKFLVPFSLLAGIGGYFQWERAVTTAPAVSMIAGISEPFSSASVVPPDAPSPLPTVMIGVWICGIAANLFWWLIRWRQVRRAVSLASPANLDGPLRVMYGPERFEPGVFGIFRPVLLLPEGILQRLSPAQLQTVLAHELCHVQRRDNLAMAIHMIVEALFWFHPLVWFIKARLLEERERACDEEVLQLGSDPQAYAESILKICEFYLASPLTCVSGIAGSNLKKRIEDIMKNRVALHLSFNKSFLMVVAAIAALAIPILAGMARPESAQGVRGDAGTSAVPQGYRVGEIKITGAKFGDPEALRRSLGLVSGDVYNESRLRTGFMNLRRLYLDLGFVDFVPTPAVDIDEQRKVVNLTVDIEEGRPYSVRRISFTGNTRTPDEVIRREVLVKEGQIFNSSLMDQSLTRLNQLGLFEEIKPEDVRVDPSVPESKLDIAIRLKEKGR